MPEFIVLSSCHTPSVISFGMNVIAASAKAAFTPPVCRLREVTFEDSGTPYELVQGMSDWEASHYDT